MHFVLRHEERIPILENSNTEENNGPAMAS